VSTHRDEGHGIICPLLEDCAECVLEREHRAVWYALGGPSHVFNRGTAPRPRPPKPHLTDEERAERRRRKDEKAAQAEAEYAASKARAQQRAHDVDGHGKFYPLQPHCPICRPTIEARKAAAAAAAGAIMAPPWKPNNGPSMLSSDDWRGERAANK
jgi:hypothetical protein